MSGNLILSFTNAFNAMFGMKPTAPCYEAPYDSAESLGYANHKLTRGICPQCDRVTSMTKTEHDDGTHTQTCGKCGAQYLMAHGSGLLKLEGYHQGIHEKYQRDIANELASIHWQATYNMEVEARKVA